MAKKKENPRIREISPVSWNRPRLKDLLRRISGQKVLVIGDVGVDRYTIGEVERISPEAPVPIVWVKEERLKLGLAANVADNIRALGGRPLLTGIVGKDRSAEDFRGLLRKSKIAPATLVTDPSRRTVLKERIVSERQQLLRVDYESAHQMSRKVERELIRKIEELVAKCDAVILEDYAKGMLTPRVAKAVFVSAHREGRIVAVDPNSKTSVDFYRGATVLTPNTKEAESLSGIKVTDHDSLVLCGEKILQDTHAKNVVITRGKEGMAIFAASSREVQVIPTYAREVFDVSGAGDTVIAVLALALAAEGSMEDAAILGNLAAGVEVGKSGTATVSVDEIRMAMEFFEAIRG